MKKIFTLIAMAVMAISANAQTFTITETPTVGQKVTSVENITMTFGGAAATYQNSKGADLTDKYGEKKDNKWSTVYTGRTDGNGNNPVDDNNKGYNKENENVPTRGTFYIFEPTVAGTLEVAFVCNGGKNFFFLEDGKDISETMKNTHFSDENGGENSATFSDQTFSDKVYGTAQFEVKAGSKYYIFCTGSKLGFGGFTFPASAATGISSLKVANENCAIYNLAGQQVDKNYKGVVIQNGKKFVIK